MCIYIYIYMCVSPLGANWTFRCFLLFLLFQDYDLTRKNNCFCYMLMHTQWRLLLWCAQTLCFHLVFLLFQVSCLRNLCFHLVFWVFLLIGVVINIAAAGQAYDSRRQLFGLHTCSWKNMKTYTKLYICAKKQCVHSVFCLFQLSCVKHLCFQQVFWLFWFLGS